MAHNIGSMAYYGETPWHGLGAKISERADAAQMIRDAGLDWEVEKRAIPNVGGGNGSKPRRYHLVRKPRNASGAEVPLGVVSPKYELLQNTDAFAFFDPIILDKKAVFETAGSLGNGERVWVLAKAPGEIVVRGNDTCMKYLLLSNSHDGRGSVTVKFTPVRVVCQNTLILALESGEKAHCIRHSKNMQDRLQEVQTVLRLMWQTFEEAERQFRHLARVPVKAAQLETYLDAVYPMTDEQRRTGKVPERWGRVTEIFEKGDAPTLKPDHTLWGAYNAVTRYEDYRPSKEDGADRRLGRVWFGQGADVKLLALQQAGALARQWATQG